MADASADSHVERRPPTPLWVKVFGLVFLAVVVLFLILMFGRGPHRGPGGHSMGGHFGHGASESGHR
jgi:hypothetical protein